MQSTLILVSSLILGAGAAVGVTSYMNHGAADAADEATDPQPDLAARILELEDELTGLRRRVAQAVAPGPRRESIDPVTDARIEAAVARWLAKNPVDASASKAPAKKALTWAPVSLKSREK